MDAAGQTGGYRVAPGPLRYRITTYQAYGRWSMAAAYSACRLVPGTIHLSLGTVTVVRPAFMLQELTRPCRCYLMLRTTVRTPCSRWAVVPPQLE